MTEVSAVDVARLERLEAQASDAPWLSERSNGVHTETGYCRATTHAEPRQQRINDAEFIAAMRNATPSLLAAYRAVERVRALHAPTTKPFLVDSDCGDGGVCDHDGMDCPVGEQLVCAHCFTLGDSQSEWETNVAESVMWPCQTIRALDGAE